MIEVFIADSNYIYLEGIKTLIKGSKGVKLVGEADNSEALFSEIEQLKPHILMLNYSSPSFDFGDIDVIINLLPKTKILAITNSFTKEGITSAIDAGITGHVLMECSKKEISDAIYATANEEKFFCGKIVEKLMSSTKSGAVNKMDTETNCEPVKISSRELDVITLIAEGNTNKEVANELFISTHTVMTHRKNIMNKLGINNTAGLVLYAVRENLINPKKYIFDQGNL